MTGEVVTTRTTSTPVPYRSRVQIRRDASVLLQRYGERFRPVLEPPVPVEEILELHLGLTFEIADLRELFGVGDVLGALSVVRKTVQVDASLDPTIYPGMLGRHRFTIGHEIGHWELHRRLFHAGTYVCRSSQAKEPIEWQADYFSAQLLMPAPLVRAAWEQWRGNLCPARPGTSSWRGQARAAASAAERFCFPLAERFKVSAAAMRIRLEEMGLLTSDNE